MQHNRPTIQCPAGCGSARVIKNGGYQHPNLGRVQRYRCRVCGARWKVFARWSALQPCPDKRWNTCVESFVQAAALLVLRIPLAQIERLVGLKSETIRDHLTRLIGDVESRRCLERVLMRSFGLSWESVSAFTEHIDGVVAHFVGLRSWTSEGFGARMRDPATRRRTAKIAGRILGDTVCIRLQRGVWMVSVDGRNYSEAIQARLRLLCRTRKGSLRDRTVREKARDTGNVGEFIALKRRPPELLKALAGLMQRGANPTPQDPPTKCPQ